MLAIMGLMGMAVTAFLFVGTDEDDGETSHSDALQADDDPSVDIIPLEDLMDPSDEDTVVCGAAAAPALAAVII